MFDRNRIVRILILTNILLLICYWMTNYFVTAIPRVIRRWFDLDAEANIPTWFSSSQLLVAFLLSLSYSLTSKDRLLSKFYLLLSFALLFFSVDETSMIHEGLTIISKKMSINSPLPHGHGAWIFVYSAMLFSMALLFRRSVIAFFQEKVGRAAFLTGAILFAMGSVGLEVLGYYLSAATSSRLQYLIEVCCEEGFELLGESLLIYALLAKMAFVSTTNCPERNRYAALPQFHHTASPRAN